MSDRSLSSRYRDHSRTSVGATYHEGHACVFTKRPDDASPLFSGSRMHFTPFPVVDHLHNMHDHLNSQKKESLWRENLQSGGTPAQNILHRKRTAAPHPHSAHASDVPHFGGFTRYASLAGYEPKNDLNLEGLKKFTNESWPWCSDSTWMNSHKIFNECIGAATSFDATECVSRCCRLDESARVGSSITHRASPIPNALTSPVSLPCSTSMERLRTDALRGP